MSGTTCRGSASRVVNVSLAWGISASSPSSEESSISYFVKVETKNLFLVNNIKFG